MPQDSARHSFHGPLLVTDSQRGQKAKKADPLAPAACHPLELVPAPPSASSVGRAVLEAARAEQPSTSQRERILAGVLAALQRLTSASANG